MNPEGGPRTAEAIGNPADHFSNFDEWGLPAGAEATQWEQGVTISLQPSCAAQVHRIFALVVWCIESSDHIDPAARRRMKEEFTPSFKLKLPPRRSYLKATTPCSTGRILARLTGWSPETRRRDHDQPKLVFSLGDNFRACPRPPHAQTSPPVAAGRQPKTQAGPS